MSRLTPNLLMPLQALLQTMLGQWSLKQLLSTDKFSSERLMRKIRTFY